MTRDDKEFFTLRFNELYDQKWRSRGLTQKDFTNAIRELEPRYGISEAYVSKLLSGKYFPKLYLSAICKILDVDISEFTPKTHDEKYQYASDFADGLEGDLEELAVKNFGIDLTFIQGLRNIIPDFDTLYPQFLPVACYDEGDSNHKVYQRRNPAKAVETPNGKGVLQIKKNGKIYFLSVYDLKILKMIQDKFAICSRKLFRQLKTEFDNAEATIVLKYEEMIPLYNPDYSEDKTLNVAPRLSDEEIQSIDRYGMYTEKEWNKYHLPPKGEKLFPEAPDNTEGK